jgi:hypothetical protein
MRLRKIISIIVLLLVFLSQAMPVDGAAAFMSEQNEIGQADLSAKPDNGIELEVLIPDDVVPRGEKLQAILKITNKLETDSTEVLLDTTEQIQLSSNQFILSGNQYEEKEVTFDLLAISEGESKVRVSVNTTDKQGNAVNTIRDIFVLATEEEVYVSKTGFDEIKLKDLKDKKQKGKVTDQEYKKQEKLIKRGDARIDTSVTLAAKPSVQTITVSGRVEWTDSAGNVHPAKFVPVEIMDDDVIFDDTLATTKTDNNGNYSAVITNDTGFSEGGYDIFVRIKSEGDGFEIKSEGLFGEVYSIETDVSNNLPNGAVVSDQITLNNTDNSNTAFSVHQCMILANQFVNNIHGSSLDKVSINFPTGKSTSCLSGGEIYLLQLDRFDWDVILHEYGHYVQKELDTADSPGGKHSSGENLSDRLSKDNAIRLAWSEGWATYFAIDSQLSEYASLLGVPNVGDKSYQDTEDTTIVNDLEASGGSHRGEDNELAVSRVLIDLSDGSNETEDVVSLGRKTMWTQIDNNNSTTLSQAMNAMTSGKSVKELADIGKILSIHKIASLPTSPADGSNIKSTTVPTFRWTANGDSTKYKNNSFVVEFYESTFNTKLLESPVLTTNSYTPSEDDWKKVFENYDRKIYWIVRAKQTDSPATGEYVSKPMLLNKPTKLDLVFLIDTTGSMWDDIDNVKNSVSTIVDTVSTKISDYRIAVADFRDFPQAPYGETSDYVYKARCGFTNDKSQIISAVNSLSADGGYDWQESVYSGLMNAIAAKDLGSWRTDAERIIILIGDAPPHDPEPYTGYTINTVIDAAKKALINTTSDVVEPFNTMPSSIMCETKADDEYIIEDGEDDTIEESEGYGSVLIFPVMVGYDYSTREIFSSLAEGTGGQLFDAPTASTVSDCILEIISTVSEDISVNKAPDVTGAKADNDVIWSPNNKMVPITIQNVTDPDGDEVTITITAVTQDESLTKEADATGIGTNTVYVRASRDGKGNGRVYKISFQAVDSKGAISEGYVYVSVPHDQGKNEVVIDDGQIYNSTQVK